MGIRLRENTLNVLVREIALASPAKDSETDSVFHFQDPMWLPTKKRCQELHQKLSYIKTLVADYDKSAANT